MKITSRPLVTLYHKPGQSISIGTDGRMYCTLDRLDNPNSSFSYTMTERYEGPKTHQELIASGYEEEEGEL